MRRSGRRSPEPFLKKENAERIPGLVKRHSRRSPGSRVPTRSRVRPSSQFKPLDESISRPPPSRPNSDNHFSYAAALANFTAIPTVFPDHGSKQCTVSASNRPTTFVTPPSSLSKSSPLTDAEDSPRFQIAKMEVGEGDQRSFSDLFSDAWDDSSIVTGQSIIGRSTQIASSTTDSRSHVTSGSGIGGPSYLDRLTKRIPMPASTMTSQVKASDAPRSAVADIFDDYTSHLDSNWTLAAATDGSGGCDSRHDLANRTDSEDDYEDPFVFDSNSHLHLAGSQSRSQLFSNLPHTTPPSNASFAITAPMNLSSSPPSPPPSPPSSRASRFRSGTVDFEDKPKTVAKSRFSITPIEPLRPGSEYEEDTFRRFSLRRTKRVDGAMVFVQDIGDEHIDEDDVSANGVGSGSVGGGIGMGMGRWRVEVDADGLPKDMLQMLDELEGFAKELRDMNEGDLETRVSPKTGARIRSTLSTAVQPADSDSESEYAESEVEGIKELVARESETMALPKIVVTQSFQSMSHAVEVTIPEVDTSGSLSTQGTGVEVYSSVLEGVLELCGAYDIPENEEEGKTEVEEESEDDDERVLISSVEKGKGRAVEDIQEQANEVTVEATVVSDDLASHTYRS